MNDAFPGAVCSLITVMCESLLGESVDVSLSRNEEAASALWVRLGFSGEYSGEVWVGPSQALVTRVSNQVFSSDSDITQSDLEDTARELGNIVAGNIKTLLPAATRIGLPEVQTVNPAPFVGRGRDVHLSVDGDPLSVLVRWLPQGHAVPA